MKYHFYFKDIKPVYETEYMQSLKQFAVLEVFPAYILKISLLLLNYNQNSQFSRRYKRLFFKTWIDNSTNKLFIYHLFETTLLFSI